MSAVFWLVGLGEYGGYLVTCLYKCVKAGDGEVGSAHENYLHIFYHSFLLRSCYTETIYRGATTTGFKNLFLKLILLFIFLLYHFVCKVGEDYAVEVVYFMTEGSCKQLGALIFHFLAVAVLGGHLYLGGSFYVAP